jgi:hypothetical protein
MCAARRRVDAEFCFRTAREANGPRELCREHAGGTVLKHVDVQFAELGAAEVRGEAMARTADE